MKCDRTFFLIGCCFTLGLGLITGCQQDRQMIFNNPRTLRSQDLSAKATRDRERTASKDLTLKPKPKPLPASNGIDVPIVTPD
jgi:hypothetical protein